MFNEELINGEIDIFLYNCFSSNFDRIYFIFSAQLSIRKN